LDESRHIQILNPPAMISAITLTHMGAWWVPTVTWACLINRKM